MIKRRDFLGFFLLGGLASLVQRKLRPKIVRENIPHPTSSCQGEVRWSAKEAMFWRRKE